MKVKLFLLLESSSLVLVEESITDSRVSGLCNVQHHSSVKLFHLKIMSSQEFEKLKLLRIFMQENYH